MLNMAVGVRKEYAVRELRHYFITSQTWRCSELVPLMASLTNQGITTSGTLNRLRGFNSLLEMFHRQTFHFDNYSVYIVPGSPTLWTRDRSNKPPHLVTDDPIIGRPLERSGREAGEGGGALDDQPSYCRTSC